MRELTIIPLCAEVKQFCRDWCVKHKIAVEEPIYQRVSEVDEPICVGGVDMGRTLYASMFCSGGERAAECGHSGYCP